MEPDKAIESFKHICEEFKGFIVNHPHVSEADTRVKIIERTLKEVLGWKEATISREDHSKGIRDGFTDYKLYLNKKAYIVVEAKRSGIAFELPTVTRRKLKISGVLQSSAELISAIEQARQYCVDEIPIPFTIVTNGIAWIIFKSTYTDASWRDENLPPLKLTL